MRRWLRGRAVRWLPAGLAGGAEDVQLAHAVVAAVSQPRLPVVSPASPSGKFSAALVACPPSPFTAVAEVLAVLILPATVVMIVVAQVTTRTASPS
jgi:hypothetical protein